MLNGLTVDVEDWFQVSAFRDHIDFNDWEHQESRILPNICRVLKLLDEFDVKATFFVLGWIAERYPEIVLTIRKHGHEIGSHGYAHKVIYEQSRKEFEADLEKSLAILESIADQKIIYYRAPSFSITRKSMWALEVLANAGIKYDSSIFPIKHDIGGFPTMPRVPFYVKFKNGKVLHEFPLSTMRFWGENIPICGGGYLRLLPFWFVKRGIKKNNASGVPAVLYFHPWELDPDQPRLKLKLTSRFRHYSNLEFTEERIRSLLATFKFGSLGALNQSYDIDLQWPRIEQSNGKLTERNTPARFEVGGGEAFRQE